MTDESPADFDTSLRCFPTGSHDRGTWPFSDFRPSFPSRIPIVSLPLSRPSFTGLRCGEREGCGDSEFGPGGVGTLRYASGCPLCFIDVRLRLNEGAMPWKLGGKGKETHLLGAWVSNKRADRRVICCGAWSAEVGDLYNCYRPPTDAIILSDKGMCSKAY